MNGQLTPVEEPTIPAKPNYIPSREECLMSYEIGIRFLNRGCIIRVGCKEIAFSNTDEAIKELNKYFQYPYDQQELWRKQIV